MEHNINMYACSILNVLKQKCCREKLVDFLVLTSVNAMIHDVGAIIFRVKRTKAHVRENEYFYFFEEDSH